MQTNGHASQGAQPRTQGQAEDALTGRPMTLDYRPGLASWMWGGDGAGGGRFGDLWAHLKDVERMVSHPDVVLPYGYYKSGISEVKFTVRAEDDEQAEEAHGILTALWENHLEQLQLCYDYGWCGYEIAYTVDGGRLEFDSLYDLLPLDCWALTVGGAYRGFRLKGSGGWTPQGVGAGSADLWGPGKWPAKGLWLTHDRRWDRFYGRSQLRGAWRPWKRLAGVDGAEDVCDGAIYRFGYQGPEIYYPPEDFRKKDGGEFDYEAARNEARQMAEQAKAGFSVAFPNAMIPGTTQRKWEMKWPSSVINVAPLLDYEGHLQKAISRGVGTPPELFEASETGSGWSGRKVPLLGFYVGQRKDARGLLKQLVRQIVVPILKWNHGRDAWCEAEVDVVLPEAIAGEPPPGANPPVPTGGALPQPPGPMPGAEPEAPAGGAPDLGPLAQLLPQGGAEMSTLSGDDWLDPGWYPEDDVESWSVPVEGYELAAPDPSRYQQRQITRGPRQGGVGWYDVRARKFMPATWTPRAAAQKKPAPAAPPARAKAPAKAVGKKPAAPKAARGQTATTAKPAAGAAPASPFKPEGEMIDLASVKKHFADREGKIDGDKVARQVRKAVTAALAEGREVDIVADGKKIPIVSTEGDYLRDKQGKPWGVAGAVLFAKPGEGVRIGPAKQAAKQAAAQPAAQMSPPMQRIQEAAKKDLADPQHPVNRLKDRMATADFGAGPVRTLRGTKDAPLSRADHEAMDRMHSRTAAALKLNGDEDMAKAQLAAAQYHRAAAAKKGAPAQAAPAADWPPDDANRKFDAETGRDLDRGQREFRSRMPGAQRKALTDYTGNLYEEINALARGKKPPADLGPKQESQWRQAAQSLGRMDAAFEAAGELEKPAHTYRGISVPRASADAMLAGFRRAMESGDSVGFGGYMSTTAHPGVIDDFAKGNPGDVPMRFEVRAKKGIYMDPLAKQSSKGEYELLLPRKSRFRVAGIKTLSLAGKKHQVVQLEQL